MKHVELEPVKGKPRWRLAWCGTCSDGYRGMKATAEKWAVKHEGEHHGEQR